MKKNIKYLFLEHAILGQQVNLDNSKDVIDKCLRLAYKDMLTAGRYYIKINMDLFINEYYQVLTKNNFINIEKIIDDTLFLFGNNEKIINQKGFVTRYGLSQKIVNMTFKYLYIYYDYLNEIIDFNQCDCPLDSIILNKINYKEQVWSKLTKEQYKKCQCAIKQELEKQQLNDELKQVGNLAFDFLNW